MIDLHAVLFRDRVRGELLRQIIAERRPFNGGVGLHADPDFVSRIDRSSGLWACWPWTGGRSNGRGSGLARAGGLRRSGPAYRLAYWLETGFWAKSNGSHTLCIRHLCHNPICVNPRHLLSGTRADNKWDDYMRSLGVDLVALRREIEEGPFALTTPPVAGIAR